VLPRCSPGAPPVLPRVLPRCPGTVITVVISEKRSGSTELGSETRRNSKEATKSVQARNPEGYSIYVLYIYVCVLYEYVM